MVNAMTGQLEQLSGAESIFNLAMAATGGGKIRSRRYHIASKPYAKSKQVNEMTKFVWMFHIEG